MKQTCSNCQSLITCGCQKRIASDGTQVCTKCLDLYEKTLNELKQASPAEKNKKNTR